MTPEQRKKRDEADLNRYIKDLSEAEYYLNNTKHAVSILEEMRYVFYLERKYMNIDLELYRSIREKIDAILEIMYELWIDHSEDKQFLTAGIRNLRIKLKLIPKPRKYEQTQLLF